MAEQISPGERRELRSVVRQQMKVLRAEVGQREIELTSEVEARLVQRYRDDDHRADEMHRRIDNITAVANQQLREALTEFEDLSDGGRWRGMLSGSPTPDLFATPKRGATTHRMLAGVKVHQASPTGTRSTGGRSSAGAGHGRARDISSPCVPQPHPQRRRTRPEQAASGDRDGI